MKKQSRDWIKAGNYVIVKLSHGDIAQNAIGPIPIKHLANTWVIGYIEIDELYEFISTCINKYSDYCYPIRTPRSSINIKPLSNVMLTSDGERHYLMFKLIEECALKKYEKKSWCKKYRPYSWHRKESFAYIEETLKFKLVKHPTIKIDEDYIYKDIGNIISSYAPQYTLTNIVDSNTYIGKGRKIKYDDIIIDEFIFNQSLTPFYNIVDQMHDKFMEYNTSIKN